MSEYNWLRVRVMECVKIEIIKKRASIIIVINLN